MKSTKGRGGVKETCACTCAGVVGRGKERGVVGKRLWGRICQFERKLAEVLKVNFTVRKEKAALGVPESCDAAVKCTGIACRTSSPSCAGDHTAVSRERKHNGDTHLHDSVFRARRNRKCHNQICAKEEGR